MLAFSLIYRNMKEILIFDNYFTGSTSSTYGIVNPLKFKWVNGSRKYGSMKNVAQADKSVVFYTDNCVWTKHKIGDVKIAWLLEPDEFLPGVHHWIKENYEEFDIIFTWDKSLLELSNKFKFYTPGNSWIPRNQIEIYPKDKLLSISASWKKFMSGHKIRHEIIDAYMVKYNIHWYGKRGLNPEENYILPFDPNVQNTIEHLIDAYKDYMFTIVVENVSKEDMFSEKIVSPILCGTIPIYYGIKTIGNYFDERGIIQFSSVEELDEILASLSPEKYESMLEYAKINFEKAKKYQLLEDGIYDQLVEMNIIKE